MRKSDKKPLLEKLASLSDEDRQRLYKQAARKRKAAIADKRTKKRVNYTREYNQDKLTEDRGFEKRKGPRPVSLEDWVLKLLAEEDFDKKAAATDAAKETHQGIVLAVRSSKCRVAYDGQEIKCLLRPELTMGQRSDLAVGDDVKFSHSDDGTPIVEEVLPRRTALTRPDPHDNRLERVIAANIDATVIVTSVVAPPLSTHMIDRYLLAIDRGGIQPLICVNKIDLFDPADDNGELERQLEPYRELGITIVKCSAANSVGIEELLGTLSNKLVVFVGHSGVGKSSILNTIKPQLNLETRDVRKTNSKGRHTTVKSNLYELDDGVRIIDTPGVRSFGLWKMAVEDLRWYFDEFDAFTDDCKFSDCTHTHEPDCAVKVAAENDPVLKRRYTSYFRMIETLND